VISYSALESLILGAARFHSDCAALPISMAVLTLESAEVVLGFLADLLAPNNTNLPGTRLKDLALTAFESGAIVLNKDHFQPGEPWAAKPKPTGKKGAAEGSENDDEAGPSPRLLLLGVLFEPLSHPPKPRRSVLAYLVSAYFESGRARAADRAAGSGRKDFICACQPRAGKAARVGVLVTRIASAAERSSLVRIHTLFADIGSSAAGEAFGALRCFCEWENGKETRRLEDSLHKCGLQVWSTLRVKPARRAARTQAPNSPKTGGASGFR
jgi:hypothetical protein